MAEKMKLFVDENIAYAKFFFEDVLLNQFPNFFELTFYKDDEFDLEDQNLLKQTNILFSPSAYIKEKFYNDAFLSIDLVKMALGQFDLGPAAAMSLIYFFIVLLVCWVFYTLMMRNEGNQ